MDSQELEEQQSNSRLTVRKLLLTCMVVSLGLIALTPRIQYFIVLMCMWVWVRVTPPGPWVDNLEAALPGGGSVRYCNRLFRNGTQEAVFWTHPSGKVDAFLIQETHGPSAQIVIRLSDHGEGVWFDACDYPRFPPSAYASLDLRTGQFIAEGGSVGSVGSVRDPRRPLHRQWGSGVATSPEWVNSKRSRVLARKRFRR